MEIITNASNVAALLEKLNDEMRLQRPALFKSVGSALQKDAQNRIITQDAGRWPALSKWVKAKKDPQRALQGAEQYVRFRVTGNGVEVYGETGADWTLTQHHEGFENKANHIDADGRVSIEIVNPGPLGLGKAGTFTWSPKDNGHTPARKIWADTEEAEKITLPIASRWLQTVVTRALQGGVLGTIA